MHWRCHWGGTGSGTWKAPRTKKHKTSSQDQSGCLGKGGGPSSLVVPSQSPISLLTMDLRMCQETPQPWSDGPVYKVHVGRMSSIFLLPSSHPLSGQKQKLFVEMKQHKWKVNKSISLFSRWLIHDKNKFLCKKFRFLAKKDNEKHTF